MRTPTLALGLVLGLVFLASGTQAATLQCYAKVNIVPGTEAMMVPQAMDPAAAPSAAPATQLEALTATAPDGHLQFALNGPVDSQVRVQLTPLDDLAQWEDQVDAQGAQIASGYDSDGFLLLDFGPDQIQLSSRMVLSLTYE